jgi:hypothetical protein
VGRPLPLTAAWWTGARLYGALGRLDAWKGVESWEEAVAWLAAFDGPIAEVQYWGHGQWGNARVDRDVLDLKRLSLLDPLRGRVGLWWFRTCQTFGAREGHDFARAFTDHLGADAAGHTHVIGAWQSGLHRLAAGTVPGWPAEEGIAEGTPDAPRKARRSGPWRPNTITCLDGAVPSGW